ncbi:MAG TPA: hypothetical protein VI819_03605 [Patescibacteria group bacterium]|nr:hypothetical protein [Patescibacteria group bacterium]
MNNLLAQFGRVNPPPGVSSWIANAGGNSETGLQRFVSAIIQTLIAGAGIYALINLVMAGYSFMSAGGNPEKIAQSWGKIWQTLLGLLVAAGAFVLAGVFGQIIFGNPRALIQIQIFTP